MGFVSNLRENTVGRSARQIFVPHRSSRLNDDEVEEFELHKKVVQVSSHKLMFCRSHNRRAALGSFQNGMDMDVLTSSPAL